ncbi:hypothetical protein JHK84_050759 [Glycine max]|nr:hypothetical protein JHK84_050759 [Glycine max]
MAPKPVANTIVDDIPSVLGQFTTSLSDSDLTLTTYAIFVTPSLDPQLAALDPMEGALKLV